MPEPVVRLWLDIESAEPVAGRLAGPAGRVERFDGWLELMSVLDRAIATTEPGAPPVEGDDREAPPRASARGLAASGVEVTRGGGSAMTTTIDEAGFTRFRRATETPLNLILEAKP